jgi:hypothetical protein
VRKAYDISGLTYTVEWAASQPGPATFTVFGPDWDDSETIRQRESEFGTMYWPTGHPCGCWSLRSAVEWLASNVGPAPTNGSDSESGSESSEPIAQPSPAPLAPVSTEDSRPHQDKGGEGE